MARVMKAAAVAAISASLLVAPAQASDFSQIGEPAGARALLISPQRHQEVFCVSLAHYEVRNGGSFRDADARQMAEVLTGRLAGEIGDENIARELVDARVGWFDSVDQDSVDTKELKKGVVAEIGARCKPLLDAYRSGGKVGFEAKLAPSEGLIPLLSMPRCVALAEYISARDPHPMFNARDIADLHELAREGRSVAEIKVLEEAIDAERATLAAAKPDLEQLGMSQIACMATFRLRAEEVGRTSF